MHRAFRAALGIAALAGAVALAAGCKSAPSYVVRAPVDLDDMARDGAASQNTIVVKQTQLTIPEGWAFQWKKEDDSSIFFRFFDRLDNVEGSFEYVRFDFDIDPGRAAIAYATDILKENGARDIALHRTVIDGNPSTIITAKDSAHGWDIFTAVITEGRRNLNVIRILSNPDWLFKHPEVAYRIFASYRFSAKETSQRNYRELVNFYCDESKWIWINDVDNGFVVSGKVREEIVTIILEKTSATSLREVEARWSFGDFNIPEFQSEIVIDGQSFRGKGSGRRDLQKGYVVTSYLLDRGGSNIQLVIGYDEPRNARSPFSPETLHKEPEIVEFFAKFLSLSGGGPRQTFGRCGSDKDCTGDTVCEKGLCTSPAPALKSDPAKPSSDPAKPSPDPAKPSPDPAKPSPAPAAEPTCDPVKGCPADFILPKGAALLEGCGPRTGAPIDLAERS